MIIGFPVIILKTLNEKSKIFHYEKIEDFSL